MRKTMSISASKISWKQIVKFGCILTVTVAVTLVLCKLFAFPMMENNIKNQLLYGELLPEEMNTEKVSFDKKELEYVTTAFETELRIYLEEYFENTEVESYFGEDAIEKLVEQITLRLKEAENVVWSKEKIEELIAKELTSLVVKEEEGDAQALEALKQELVQKINILASSGNYDAIIEKHSTTLSSIVTDMGAAKEELHEVKESLVNILGSMGDCTVSYNAQDGHFYITYKGGADTVTKKLDYVP